MTKSTSEVAKWFDAIDAAGGRNFGSEVYPGYPGIVVSDGKVQAMSWGFPLALKGKRGQLLKPRPVNNARTDKLRGPFWRSSFEHRRCLIPLSAWAEAEGATGGKTRTWLSLPDTELFAVAGIWRWSEEWGEVYSMVMTDSAGPASEVHSRMPAIVGPDDYSAYLTADAATAFNLCRAWQHDVAIDRTGEPWTKR